MGEKICVVGLGYVGLPLAVAFAQKFSVVGCDANPDRIRELRDGRDSAGEVSPDDFAAVSENLSFSASAWDVRQCGVFIIAVPTPVCSDFRPDLAILEGACRSVGAVLKPGDLVVVESTVYPGVTEEICAPILEKESGLKFNRDFACGYSPERVSPGDGPLRMGKRQIIPSALHSRRRWMPRAWPPKPLAVIGNAIPAMESGSMCRIGSRRSRRGKSPGGRRKSVLAAWRCVSGRAGVFARNHRKGEKRFCQQRLSAVLFAEDVRLADYQPPPGFQHAPLRHQRIA